MGPESISLWLIILGILALFDAIIGGKYLFKVGEFLWRLVVVITIFTIATIANHNVKLATYLHHDLYYVTILIAIVIIAVLLYDMIRVVIKHDDLNERRNRGRHHARTTPARH